MSLRIATSEWISNSLIIGQTSLGVLGSNIPSTGTNGASFLYNDLSLPADNNKEIRALILTYPSAGILYTYEDGSFTFSGAPDGTYTFTYQLYVDGVLTGSPATVTLNVGSSLSASGQVISTVTATLATGIKLGSSVFSVSASSASITTAIKLAASAVVAASISADLLTATGFNANVTSQSQIVANLSTQTLFQVFAQARATGTAYLTVTGPGHIGAGDKLIIKYMGPSYDITLS